MLSAVAVACALLAAGCGNTAPGASGSGARTSVAVPSDLYPGYPLVGASASPGPSGSAGPSPCEQQPPACAGVGAPEVSLDATIHPPDNAQPYTLTLRCDPDGGTVADPASACAQLLADPGLLAPSPVGRAVACPMVLASSARAVVEGTYLGRQVDETIVDGGCDLQRWAELGQIFRPASSDPQPVSPG